MGWGLGQNRETVNVNLDSCSRLKFDFFQMPAPPNEPKSLETRPMKEEAGGPRAGGGQDWYHGCAPSFPIAGSVLEVSVV